MQNPKNFDHEQLTASLADGSYYAQAKCWYGELFHRPIAERSYYVIVILMAIINVFFAFDSLSGIFPLEKKVPFTVISENALEEVPSINRLTKDASENKNFAVMRYLLKNYVINRESYDLGLYELRYRNIWSQSSESVFNAYKNQIDANNPYSNYHQLTNLAKKNITILEPVIIEETPEGTHARITFVTSVISTVTMEEIAHGRMQADLTFQYEPFKVDQRLSTKNYTALFFRLTENSLRDDNEKSRFTPMNLTVTGYQSKEILE